MIKKIIQKILYYSAKNAIDRNKFKIIAITGSAGKTSTRKAITLVLKSKYKILSDIDSGYNTEYGLPLTLLERKVPKNKTGWIIFTLSAPFLSFKKRDYDFCILEMGADKPGDIEYLISIAKPHIAVLTSILPTHLLEFKSIKNIAIEKLKIFSLLGKDDFAVFNVDSDYFGLFGIPKNTKSVSFGKNKNSNVVIEAQKYDGLMASNIFRVDGENISIHTKSLGEPTQYIFASAMAVGKICGVANVDIKKALEKYEPVPGRMNILEARCGAVIIDDSYNANPVSVRVAIDVLGKVPGTRKIAALGSMNELGEATESSHLEVGAYVADKCDILITVGEKANEFIRKGASDASLDTKKIYSFKDSDEAGEYLSSIIQKGDVILVKGSQNKVRMEFLIKHIMAHPEMASSILCRQGGIWGKKK